MGQKRASTHSGTHTVGLPFALFKTNVSVAVSNTNVPSELPRKCTIVGQAGNRSAMECGLRHDRRFAVLR